MSPFILLISNGLQPSYEKGFANGVAEHGMRVELIFGSHIVKAGQCWKRLEVYI